MSGSKTILGLDLGTNSIGWALVEIDLTKKNSDYGSTQSLSEINPAAYSLVVICLSVTNLLKIFK